MSEASVRRRPGVPMLVPVLDDSRTSSACDPAAFSASVLCAVASVDIGDALGCSRCLRHLHRYVCGHLFQQSSLL